MSAIFAEVRYGFRASLKHPAFTLIAVATLSLGVGAVTAVCSVVDGVLLNPLGYQQPDRLAAITSGRLLVAADMVIGLLVVLVIRRWLGALVCGIEAHDSVGFVAGRMLLVGIALYATWIAALRGARIDPIEALRLV